MATLATPTHTHTHTGEIMTIPNSSWNFNILGTLKSLMLREGERESTRKSKKEKSYTKALRSE